MTRDALIEQVTSAHRTQDLEGRVRPHEAWHDLDEGGRTEAHRRTLAQRRLEAALDPAGWSTTAHAVMAKIGGGRPA